MEDSKDSYGRVVVKDKFGNATGVRAGNTKQLETESEDEKDRKELEGVPEYNRDSILRMQAKRRAARTAPAPSPSPVESPVVLKPKE